MEGQQFCLRWHNFQNTLMSSLPTLLDGGHLTDVTLSAGGRHIHAHKIILSACSYYFKELFKDLSSLQHPVIVLPGMEYGNLCALVTFMYSGEVNIYQEQLPALLAMANMLHIRGLADIAGKTPRHDNGLYVQPPLTIPSQEKTLPEATIKRETKNNTPVVDSVKSLPIPDVTHNSDEESYTTQENIPFCVKTTPYYSINAKLNQKEKVPALINASSNKCIEKRCSNGTMDEIASIPDDIATQKDMKLPPIWDTNLKFLNTPTTNRAAHSYNKSNVTCFICGKQLSNQYNLRVHMETHSNSSYSCTACSHVSRSRDALRKHVSYRHPVATPQKRARYSTPKL